MAETTAAIFQSIPLDNIRPAAHQARKNFDDESLKALAESMKQEGLLQPISVRQAGEQFELISGERRLRAAKLLGWPAIDAKIVQTVSEAEAAAKGLVENLQRDDLNPLEEAEGFQALLDLKDSHWTQDQIAKVTGKDKTYISRTLDLNNLADPVKDELRRRNFSRNHGIELSRLSNQEDQLKAAKEVKNKDLSVQATRKFVDQALGGVEKAVKSAKQVADSPDQDSGLPRKDRESTFSPTTRAGNGQIPGGFKRRVSCLVLKACRTAGSRRKGGAAGGGRTLP